MIKKSASSPRLPGGVLKNIERVKSKVKVKSKNELRVITNADPKRISKLKNVKKMRSLMGDSAENIQQLLETGDNDTAVSLIYKKLLQTLVDLIPYAEKQIRDTKGARGVYQVNALISNIRELMVDIQSAQDRSLIADSIVERIIQPAFRDLGSGLVKEFETIEGDTRAIMLSERPLDREDVKEFKKHLYSSRSRLGDIMQTQYLHIVKETKSFLQR